MFGVAKVFSLSVALWASACAPATAKPHPDAARVLVVVNTLSSDSVELGRYYSQRRGVPAENTLGVSLPVRDEVGSDEFRTKLLDPVRAKIKSLERRVDFILLTRGVPIRIREGGYSVDGRLAAMDLPVLSITKPEPENIQRSINPYFAKNESFDSSRYGFYLVTRLDGWDLQTCKRLVDNAVNARPVKGLFLFDEAENRRSGGYGALQELMGKAKEILDQKGFRAQLETTAKFVAPSEPLMGYVSWGSNDGGFDKAAYHRLRFHPGAIAETFVSTSGYTFAKKDDHWQSLVTDLIAQGVTGVKGYVSEPFTFALARPDILFDRYTSGFNLAESFYMASPVLKWKDIVIGDPLCAPYREF
ncbi:MAG: TIGR03790 family protein [Fimbriimonadales bacterium]